MTNTAKVYVYAGSETGYTAGHWYYYDGSAWQDGGVYSAAVVVTDTTLAVQGAPADAAATGAAIAAAEVDPDKLSLVQDEETLVVYLNGNWTNIQMERAEIILHPSTAHFAFSDTT